MAGSSRAVRIETLLRYYADLVESRDENEVRTGLTGGQIVVHRDPVGVVGAIAPSHVPQCLAMFKIPLALAAGCAVVLKPSPETVLDVLAESADEAGLPAGALSILPCGADIGGPRRTPGCRQGRAHEVDAHWAADGRRLWSAASPDAAGVGRPQTGSRVVRGAYRFRRHRGRQCPCRRRNSRPAAGRDAIH